MKHTSTGKCRCGNVTFSLILPRVLESYRPVKCDCDFCMKRNASYLSHPDGKLYIETLAPFLIDKQGSKQALFLTCPDCNSLVSVIFKFPSRLKGTVNATLLSDFKRLGNPVVVSPRLLDSKEKLSRWERVWFNVIINGDDHI